MEYLAPTEVKFGGQKRVAAPQKPANLTSQSTDFSKKRIKDAMKKNQSILDQNLANIKNSQIYDKNNNDQEQYSIAITSYQTQVPNEIPSIVLNADLGKTQ